MLTVIVMLILYSEFDEHRYGSIYFTYVLPVPDVQRPETD